MSAKPASEKDSRYPSLNGLRAISIILVIIHHLSVQEKIFDRFEDNKFLMPFLGLLRDGQFGVNIFFVISGFLITSLLIQETRKTNTISFKNFYIRRTLRIFPAYYFYLLVLLALQLSDVLDITSQSWLTSLTYTKYFNWEEDWVTAHGWSLSIEEHFYLFWPFLFALGEKARKWGAILLFCLPPVLRLYTWYHPVEWINFLTIFWRIDAIVLGCLIAMYKDQCLKILNLYPRLFFALSLLGIFAIKSGPHIAESFGYDVKLLVSVFGETYGTFANLFIAVIVLYSVYYTKGWWFKFLNLKVLNFIGMLSYSIYLWQELFIGGLKDYNVSLPMCLVYTFAMALFSFYLVEKPFLKLKDRFSFKKPPSVPAASTPKEKFVEELA